MFRFNVRVAKICSGDSTCYASAENIRSSVTFEFKGMAVKLTGYLLKSFRNRSNGYHLRNLVIEAYNMKTGDWDVIHENDFEGLNGQSKKATFCIDESKQKFTNQIRLRQTGDCYCPGDKTGDYFQIVSIEFLWLFKILILNLRLSKLDIINFFLIFDKKIIIHQ